MIAFFTIKLKVQQRLQKLASFDYNNLHDWQIVEAFNKGTVEWCRRQLSGINISKTGDESSKRRIDDLQVLLNTIPFNATKRDGYYESELLPDNYFEWKRVSATATNECCNIPRPMVIYLAEETNLDVLKRDFHKKPNFEWAETFATIESNRVKIHTNNEFELSNIKLTYYRQPIRIQVPGVSDPYTGTFPTSEIVSEFKDDIVELLITECVEILANDIESFSQSQVADNSAEQNN
jgi:hypothetical protein